MEEDGPEYNKEVEAFREYEYPMLKDAAYLDHAGTALYSKSLMEKFTTDMMSNLYGNPHSASASSQLSTSRVENTRLSILRFFRADPEEFDVVFVANATAGVKLVMDALRGFDGGFAYGYHKDSHTSLVGVRESAVSSRCVDDEDVENWLMGSESLLGDQQSSGLSLFAYPAQSNLDGRRLPLSWLEKARNLENLTRPIYTLLDASAFVSTSQLDLSNVNTAADFTVLSFYKIFGFPDLGALIVRKDSGSILKQRKYFGGGTVETVVCIKEQWHASKSQSLHGSLEDGSLPIHSIMALDAAMDVHKRLYGSMNRIARHAIFLAQKLYNGLASLKHANTEPVCVMYSRGFEGKDNIHIQGPIVAFNLKTSQGAWVSNIEFERLASIRNFHIRTGGLCNPGGVASFLELEPWEIRKNFSSGLRCGGETDIYSGKITGMIRASLGAMSTAKDVEAFVSFVREFFVEKGLKTPMLENNDTAIISDLFVESLTIYPIKSCGGYEIPPHTSWEVQPEGLAWDREWCLVHLGTGQALNQKRYPRMALIKPTIDFQAGILRIRYHGIRPSALPEEISVPLSSNPSFFEASSIKTLSSRVCGESIVADQYLLQEVNQFFSAILEVQCALARFPAGGSGSSSRHSKAHMQKHQRPKDYFSNDNITTCLTTTPGNPPATPPDSDNESQKRPILLSNESPILAINRSSITKLNEEISRTGGKLASASVFRANIVLASSGSQEPYSEDHWTSLRIGNEEFQMLGSCRRCHMICVDQDTGEKNQEPFVTLAQTRRFESKVFFGSHICHSPSRMPGRAQQRPTIRVGDSVSIK